MLSTLKDGHFKDLHQLAAAGSIPLQDESVSNVLQCARFTSISNHSSTVPWMIGHTFISQNPQITNSEG